MHPNTMVAVSPVFSVKVQMPLLLNGVVPGATVQAAQDAVLVTFWPPAYVVVPSLVMNVSVIGVGIPSVTAIAFVTCEVDVNVNVTAPAALAAVATKPNANAAMPTFNT